MKLTRWALAGAIAGVLSAGTAFAQSGLKQPTVQRSAFEYGSYYAQGEATASPSDQAPAPVPAADSAPAPAVATGSCGCDSCDTGCDSCGCGGGLIDRCCKLGEPWKLFDGECLKCKGINISGWVAQSFTYNTQNPGDRWNGPVTWTDRSNEYQLNQLYLYAEKATDTKGNGWDFGYRADLLFGTDNRFTTESGLETRDQFGSPKWSTQRFYGLALPQAYGEIAKDDLKVKVGHFYSPVGYEVVPTTGNFFTTLPYTFQYGEPFTHTGALATWKASDKATIGGGIIRGWDNFGNNNPNLGALATYTRSFDDKSSYAYVGVYSNEPNFTALPPVGGAPINSVENNGRLPHSPRYLQTQVYSKPLDENWTYVLQSDFGVQSSALPDDHMARWYGLNQYLFYKFSDCFTYGTRLEWFRDEEGFRVGGFQGATPQGSLRGLPTGRAGYAGNFYEITTGFNWKPNANWVVRPNARFDWFNGAQRGDLNGGSSAGGLGGAPYDDGNKNHQVLLGFDVIALF